MFITKMSLSRRTFLRGAGATVALPFLDAMVPALGAAPAGTTRAGSSTSRTAPTWASWTPRAGASDSSCRQR
jgi:hypothetical protein